MDSGSALADVPHKQRMVAITRLRIINGDLPNSHEGKITPCGPNVISVLEREKSLPDALARLDGFVEEVRDDIKLLDTAPVCLCHPSTMLLLPAVAFRPSQDHRRRA
jgi:hypothetical protein